MEQGQQSSPGFFFVHIDAAGHAEDNKWKHAKCISVMIASDKVNIPLKPGENKAPSHSGSPEEHCDTAYDYVPFPEELCPYAHVLRQESFYAEVSGIDADECGDKLQNRVEPKHAASPFRKIFSGICRDTTSIGHFGESYCGKWVESEPEFGA
jgi:hypothetical protein